MDILLHLIDIDQLKTTDEANNSETHASIENDIASLREFRFKRVIFGINNVENIGWDSLVYDSAVESIRSAAKNLSILDHNNTSICSAFDIIPLSTTLDKNITELDKTNLNSNSENSLLPTICQTNLVSMISNIAKEILNEQVTPKDTLVLSVDFVQGNMFRGTLLSNKE